MKRLGLCFALMFYSSMVGAESLWQSARPLGLLAVEGRFEQSPNQLDRELEPYFLVGGGLDFGKWRWQSELNYASEHGGEGFIDVKTQTFGWFNWAHYVFNPEHFFNFYAGVGLGLTWYQTTTTAASASRTDRSDMNFDWGVSLGGDRVLETETQKDFLLGAEFRIYKLERTKDPILSGLLKASLRF